MKLASPKRKVLLLAFLSFLSFKTSFSPLIAKSVLSKENFLIRWARGLVEDKKIDFSALPIWEAIPLLPDFIKKFYGSIVLHTPKLEESAQGYVITAAAQALGKKIDFKVRMIKKGPGYSYSVFVGLPKELALSDIIPIPKNIDLIKIVDGGFVFSDRTYVDPAWGRVVKGINIRGRVQYAGILKNIDNMFGGLPGQMLPYMEAAIVLPKGVGSRFIVELPFGFTMIPGFLGLAPAKLIVTIEESTVAGVTVPAPAASLKGGLILRIPNYMTLDKKGLLSVLSKARKNGLDPTILSAQETPNEKDFVMYLKTVKADTEDELTRGLIAKFLKKRPSLEGNTVEEMRRSAERLMITVHTNKVKKVKGNTYSAWVNAPLFFSSVVRVLPDKAELYGEIEGKVHRLFGIKGLNAENWKASLIWDYALSGTFAGSVIGAPLALLPAGGSFGGGLQFGKSEVAMDFKGALSGTSAIGELAWRGKGSLYLRDFFEFWTKGIAKIAKTEKETKRFINRFVPDWKFEDVKVVIVPKVTAIGQEILGKQFEIKVGKLELIRGITAALNIIVTPTGFTGSGHIDPMDIKIGKLRVKLMESELDKADEKKEKDDKEKEKKGASFFVEGKAVPLTFTARSEGRLQTELGILGKFVSDSKTDISVEGVRMQSLSKVDVLGLDANVTLSFDFLPGFVLDPESLFVEAEVAAEGLDKLTNFFSEGAKLFFGKVQEDLKKSKMEAKANISKHIGDLQRGTETRINDLRNQIKFWKKRCRKKPWYERGWCELFQVRSRETALAALLWHKGITLEGVKKVGKLGVDVGISVAQVATKFVGEINKGLNRIANLVNQATKKFIGLRYVKITAKSADLTKSRLPKVSIAGVIFGKKFYIKERQWDLRKPHLVVIDILRDLGFLIGIPGIQSPEFPEKDEEETKKTEAPKKPEKPVETKEPEEPEVEIIEEPKEPEEPKIPEHIRLALEMMEKSTTDISAKASEIATKARETANKIKSAREKAKKKKVKVRLDRALSQVSPSAQKISGLMEEISKAISTLREVEEIDVAKKIVADVQEKASEISKEADKVFEQAEIVKVKWMESSSTF